MAVNGCGKMLQINQPSGPPAAIFSLPADVDFGSFLFAAPLCPLPPPSPRADTRTATAAAGDATLSAGHAYHPLGNETTPLPFPFPPPQRMNYGAPIAMWLHDIDSLEVPI